MWFNNIQIYNYQSNDIAFLAGILATEPMKPCPPHARFIYGWLPVVDDNLVQEIAGCSLISLGKEERLLPAGVIRQKLDERVKVIETNEGRTMGRSEKSRLKEEIEFDLLPQSFCLQKPLLALLDTKKNKLIINTASPTQSEQLISMLRKVVQNMVIEPIQPKENLSTLFARFITHPESLPAGFELASDCLLISPDDEKKRVNCKGYELPADEILTLLSQGLVPTEISLIWQERISLTLTQELTIKRLKCLDYLVDEFTDLKQLEEERQLKDAGLTLLAGELRALISDVEAALCEETSEGIEKPVLPISDRMDSNTLNDTVL